MSNLELEVSALTEAIGKLIHSINVLTSDMEDVFMREFSEAELDRIDDPAVKEEEGLATEPAASIEHLDGTITSAGQKVIELIEMSKKMGSPYLLNDDGRLTVDNRVLDEYNRQHYDDRLG